MTTELILLSVPDYQSALAWSFHRPLIFRPCKGTHVVDGQTGQRDLDFWRNHLSPSPTDIDTLVLALDIIQIQW
jgi:hypothetical protein